MSFARALAVILPLLLAACAEPPRPVFEAFDFDYLTRIKLDVGFIEVDANWVPRGSARHVEYLAPTRPSKAMRLMAEQRVVAGGTTGTAQVVVDDASIILVRDRFEARFALHLDIVDGQGQARGTASAEVREAVQATDASAVTATQIDLDALMRRMMAKLNVEFEYQVRQALKPAVQSTDPVVPPAPAIETQEAPPADGTAPPLRSPLPGFLPAVPPPATP